MCKPLKDHESKMLDSNSAAVVIQSYWKGYWTRQQLKTVYEWYANILNAIDESTFVMQHSKSNVNSAVKFILKRPTAIGSLNKNCELDRKESISEYSEDTFISSSSDHHTASLAPNEEALLNDPLTKKELVESKRHLAMELIWIQQAIESRRHYLQIKEQLN